MLVKRLQSGTAAYYWNPSKRDLANGCRISPEALGTDYGAALARAKLLNQYLDEWRSGRSQQSKDSIRLARGTLDWFVDCYLRSGRYARLDKRTKPSYRTALFALADIPTAETTPRRLGELPITFFTTRAIDRIYQDRLTGHKGSRIRQANKEFDVLRLAWKVVSRQHPTIVPAINPCVGLDRIRGTGTAVPASRKEVYELAHALKDAGHPHLGAAALICFEWHQRPEHVLRGTITWADYKPSEKPGHVRIRHPKTRVEVWVPLEDQGTKLYPEIEFYLAALPRLGVPIVLTPGLKGGPRPYSMSYAQHTVAQVRAAAGLPSYLTLNSCRHGGMTELGDAELTEQSIMSLSGHKTPSAARLYVKSTEKQRQTGAKRRRAWVDSNK